MKYFEIKGSPELKYAPKLKNWYGKFDVRRVIFYREIWKSYFYRLYFISISFNFSSGVWGDSNV